MREDVRNHWEIRKSNRRHPLVAWRAMQQLMKDGEATGEVFKIIEALKGNALTKLRAKILEDEEGRRLLSEKPDILDRLQDRDQLRKLPENSLGRTYLRFVEVENLSADGLMDAAMEAPTQGARNEDEIWVGERARDTHDLFHVVTGYGRDGLGEISLLEFGCSQSPNLGVRFIIHQSNRSAKKDGNWAVIEPCMTEAKENARKAKQLLGQNWEQLLERPLEEVRAQLGLVAPSIYQTTRKAYPDENHPPTEYEIKAA
jgi:ubiquinone biosynthesis protein COQ4